MTHYYASTITNPNRNRNLFWSSDIAWMYTRCTICLVCLFVLCWQGVQPTLDPSAETFWIGRMRQPRKRRRVDRCVWCERYVGWRRESRLEQLVTCQVFLNAPPLGVAYCLTKPGLALVRRQPWPVHCSAPAPDWYLFSASPTGLPFSAWPPDWHFCSVSQET